MAEIPSLGAGIGLSGRFDNQSYDMFTQGMNRVDAYGAAKNKKKVEDDKAAKEAYGKIKIEGVHRLDEQDARENMAAYISEVDAARKANPNGWQNDIAPLTAKHMQRQAQFVVNKGKLDELEKTLDEQKELKVNTPAEVALSKAIKTGSYDDIGKIPGDYWQSVGYDPETKTIAHAGIPLVDVKSMEDNYLKNPDFKSALVSVRDKSYKDPKGGTSYFDNSYIPKTAKEAEDVRIKLGIPNPVPSLESIAETLLDDTNYIKRKEYEYLSSKTLGEDYMKMGKEQQAEKFKQTLINDLANKAGVKTVRRTEDPFAPTQGDGDKKKKTMEGVVTVKTISPTEIANGIFPDADLQRQTGLPVVKTEEEVAEKNSNAYDYRALDKQIDATGVTFTNAVDLNTGKRMTDSRYTKVDKIGGVLVKAFNKDTGDEVTDDQEEIMAAKGKIIYRPVVVGSAVNKTTIKDQQGNVKETDETTLSYAPMDPFAAVLKSNGYDIAHYESLAKQKNDEANAKFEQSKGKMRGPVKPGEKAKEEKKPDETKKDWTKYKR